MYKRYMGIVIETVEWLARMSSSDFDGPIMLFLRLKGSHRTAPK